MSFGLYRQEKEGPEAENGYSDQQCHGEVAASLLYCNTCQPSLIRLEWQAGNIDRTRRRKQMEECGHVTSNPGYSEDEPFEPFLIN